MRAVRSLLAVLAVGAVLAGCSGGPLLANRPAQRPVATPPPKSSLAPAGDPRPIVLPRDDAPHHRLTEWWYYTGHLRDETGGHWGFEYVVFRAERGSFSVAWASHLALTDEGGARFIYAQRSEIGPQVDRSADRGPPGQGDQGFAFALTGVDPARPETLARTPWVMAGSDGKDRLSAAIGGDEATGAGAPGGLALDLAVEATKPPVLHDLDGWIDFGPAGGSYYYSRTRMDARGSLTIGDRRLPVTGTAWFDHQWGDFIAVGGGGWDWFAINLADGTDLTLSLVRDRDGSYPLVYGTLVTADGRSRHLDRDAFSVEVTGRWLSPLSRADYPAGWRVNVPSEGLAIELAPTVAGQELDTRSTSGVVYWEGSQHVRATRDGRNVAGEAYVELTGYAPS